MSYIGTEPKDIRSFGRTKFDYTASQGQTAFTGADDDGKVLAFTVGQIEVYVNGILMDDSDFTTTGTGTVTLASAANLNDVVNIVSFESNIPDNDYVPASGGTFTGNITASGTLGVTGATTLSGNSTVGGTLGVTGATTLSGNSTVGGTLGVTGKITSTAGITFGSDTAAENVLDDYEEGTYTPAFSTNGGAITISTVYGFYRKIGNLVYVVSGFVNQAISASSYSGPLKVSLPFTADQATSGKRDMTSSVGSSSFLSSGAAGLMGMIDTTTEVHFYSQGASSWSSPSFAGNGSSRYFHFSLCYRTA